MRFACVIVLAPARWAQVHQRCVDSKTEVMRAFAGNLSLRRNTVNRDGPERMRVLRSNRDWVIKQEEGYLVALTCTPSGCRVWGLVIEEGEMTG